MGEIKGTVYNQQAGSEGYKNVAHAGSFYSFRNSHRLFLLNLKE
jgi:hypothetical protein